MEQIGFKVSGIDWDLTTDDDSPLPTDLPTEVKVWLADVDVDDLSMDGLGVASDSLLERILNEVTEQYDWCVNNCTVTVINRRRSIEEAIHLLRNLVEELDEDVSSDAMSRHLKDALNDAKQFLGIEVADDDDGDDDDDEKEGEAV